MEWNHRNILNWLWAKEQRQCNGGKCAFSTLMLKQTFQHTWDRRNFLNFDLKKYIKTPKQTPKHFTTNTIIDDESVENKKDELLWSGRTRMNKWANHRVFLGQ